MSSRAREGNGAAPDALPGRTVLAGTPVVPGVVAGPATRPLPGPRPPAGHDGPVAEAARPAEAERFAAAAARVADRLAGRAAAATGGTAAVLSAAAAIAADRALRAVVEDLIGDGVPASAATVRAVAQFEATFAELGPPMAERVADLHDVRDRILAELTGQTAPGSPRPGVPSVLLVDELLPVDAAGLDPALVLGIAARRGSATGHAAIVVGQLGLPYVSGVEGLPAIPDGTPVLLDGGAGTVTVHPTGEEVGTRTSAAREVARELAGYRGPGVTADGHAVPVLANVADDAGARAAVAAGAEGVGLLRTELAFLGRSVEPTVAEQAGRYTAVFAALAGRPVVVRTLDAGSDKPLPFAAAVPGADPALGARGLRLARADAGVLDRQLDAIAEAARRSGTHPRVMAPMVATVAEAADFAARVRSRGLVPGVMVEVPAAALHAQRLLAHVDFLSVGTNDLAQFTLAADRLSAGLADLTDPWQPAVLALVAMATDAGRRTGRPVGVCGEAAADPLLACVLVGLGATSLSCAPAAVPRVGLRLRRVTLPDCRAAAAAALAADSPGAARAAARAILDGPSAAVGTGRGEESHSSE